MEHVVTGFGEVSHGLCLRKVVVAAGGKSWLHSHPTTSHYSRHTSQILRRTSNQLQAVCCRFTCWLALQVPLQHLKTVHSSLRRATAGSAARLDLGLRNSGRCAKTALDTISDVETAESLRDRDQVCQLTKHVHLTCD